MCMCVSYTDSIDSVLELLCRCQSMRFICVAFNCFSRHILCVALCTLYTDVYERNSIVMSMVMHGIMYLISNTNTSILTCIEAFECVQQSHFSIRQSENAFRLECLDRFFPFWNHHHSHIFIELNKIPNGKTSTARLMRII